MYEHNTLKGYIPKKKSHTKWIKQLADSWNLYLTNFKLMKLNKIPFLIVQKNKKGSYKEVCDYYELNQFKEFIENLKT